MADKSTGPGRPKVYQNGRKEFKLCLPLETFLTVERIALAKKLDISAQIVRYIESGLRKRRRPEAEKGKAA